MAERLVIRSYRRVFEVDRRIYRVDRWALPVPGGVPLRGLAYFAATVLLVVVLGGLPGIGDLVGMLTPPLRYVVLPLAVAVLGTQAAPDGRTAHRFASDWLRLRLRARRRCAGRVVPLEREPVPWHGVLAARWDADAAQLHRARIRGPAMVAFAAPVEFRDGPRGRLVARPQVAGGPQRRRLVARPQVAGGQRRRLVARPQPAGGSRPQTVVIGGGQVLEVRP